MYANRVSFVFDFKGPSMVIDTACSSSMVALDVAITDLRTGEPFFELFKIRKQSFVYNERFQTN